MRHYYQNSQWGLDCEIAARLVEFICKEIYILKSNIWFYFICPLFNSQGMFFPCVKTDPEISIISQQCTKWKKNKQLRALPSEQWSAGCHLSPHARDPSRSFLKSKSFHCQPLRLTDNSLKAEINGKMKTVRELTWTAQLVAHSHTHRPSMLESVTYPK